MEKKFTTKSSLVMPFMAAAMVAGLGTGIAGIASAQTFPAARMTAASVITVSEATTARIADSATGARALK